MKKIGILLIAIFALSCNLGSDDTSNIRQELLPIDVAVVPDEFVLNHTYVIDLAYIRPTTCHAFKDIYYMAEDNQRTIAIVANVFNSSSGCDEIATVVETSFNFIATQTGTYVFKFWKGLDENGEDQYSIYEIPVIE
ncbi:MAG: hypothetical protein ACPG6B_00555 [Oceanihabitans sp.]